MTTNRNRPGMSLRAASETLVGAGPSLTPGADIAPLIRTSLVCRVRLDPGLWVDHARQLADVVTQLEPATSLIIEVADQEPTCQPINEPRLLNLEGVYIEASTSRAASRWREWFAASLEHARQASAEATRWK